MLHPQTVQRIWDIFGKAEVDLFASKDNSYCPIYYSKGRDAMVQSPSLCLSPSCTDPAGDKTNQGTRTQGSALAGRAVTAAYSCSMPHFPEAGHSLAGEQNDMASPSRTVGSASLAT